MKKVLIFILVLFSLSLSLVAEDNATVGEEQEVSEEVEKSNIRKNRTGMELGAYYAHHLSMGKMKDFSKKKFGGGASFEYTLPVLKLVGFSARLEGEYVQPNMTRIKSWMTGTASAGLFFNFEGFRHVLYLRPEVSYGVILNLMELENKLSLYLDQFVEIGLSLRLSIPPLYKNGFSFEVTPLYTMLIQKNNPGHFLGFRAGIVYQF